MKTSSKIFSLIILTGLSLNADKLPVAGQEVLDVLPPEGRQELFHDYLMSRVDSLHQRRIADLTEALTSMEKMQQRQQRLKRDFLMLIGELPGKTPLDDTVMNTVEMDGYNIDMVVYESRPDHHVTASFYYPAKGEGPWPGILVTVGHYPAGKSIGLLQSLCILLVNRGFAVLIVDPVCQGERYQIIDPLTGKLKFIGQSGTMQHTRLDVGAMLAGTSVVAYELWDNLRGVDYLCSRPEVDTSRIGCTGSSGGGAQATYLSAFDSRIKVAAVNSYIMNEPTLFRTIGPQTGSQNLSYEGFYGIDHPEYITMFAPRPFMILCGTRDFFDIGGTRETRAEAQLVYDRLGVPEKIGYFEYHDGHGYSRPKREAAARWFRTWFYHDTATVVESPDQVLQSPDTLQVTQSGQVFYEYANEKVVEQYNAECARAYADERAALWSSQTKDSCLNRVRQLIRLEEPGDDVCAGITGTCDRDSYRVEKIKLGSGNLTPVTGLLFVPDDVKEKLPAVLYVDGRGKKTDAGAGDVLEKYCIDSGRIVFAVDLRGFGETGDDPSANEGKHGNREHRNAVISGYIGKTLIGQRVRDISMAKMYLKERDEVDASAISIVGIGRAVTSVLHAAALDTGFKEVVLRRWPDTSWITIVESPTELNNLTHVVPSALKYYDLPDLVGAIAPRPVRVAGEPAVKSPSQALSGELIEQADIIVDINGNGDYRTIREGIDAIPDFNRDWLVLLVRKGVYHEKVILNSRKTKVVLVGEDVDSTIISYDDYGNKMLPGGHTFSTYTFRADPDDFQAYNISFENPTRQGQGVAYHSNGDRQILCHCRFLGYQDTYFDNFRTRRYIRDCYIEGRTDYIFGFGVTLFDSCRIHMLESGGYITAAATPEYYEFGYVFRNCRLTCGPSVESFYLGRPWFPFANTIFYECREPAGLDRKGWSAWNGRENTCIYREYRCTGPGSDTRDRVFFGKQLDPPLAGRYTTDTILAASNFPSDMGELVDSMELWSMRNRFENSGYADRADTILYAGRDHYPEYPSENWSPEFYDPVYSIVTKYTRTFMDSTAYPPETENIRHQIHSAAGRGSAPEKSYFP